MTPYFKRRCCAAIRWQWQWFKDSSMIAVFTVALINVVLQDNAMSEFVAACKASPVSALLALIVFAVIIGLAYQITLTVIGLFFWLVGEMLHGAIWAVVKLNGLRQ